MSDPGKVPPASTALERVALGGLGDKGPCDSLRASEAIGRYVAINNAQISRRTDGRYATCEQSERDEADERQHCRAQKLRGEGGTKAERGALRCSTRICLTFYNCTSLHKCLGDLSPSKLWWQSNTNRSTGTLLWSGRPPPFHRRQGVAPGRAGRETADELCLHDCSESLGWRVARLWLTGTAAASMGK